MQTKINFSSNFKPNSVADIDISSVSEIELSYKLRNKPSTMPVITTSQDAEKIFRQGWDFDKLEFIEQFKVLFLNRTNKVLGNFLVSSGATYATLCEPKLIFIAALKVNASSIILAHNHPSGNNQPSQADIKMTKQLKEAGKFLEIQVVDHIIITSENYFSFADEGLM